MISMTVVNWKEMTIIIDEYLITVCEETSEEMMM